MEDREVEQLKAVETHGAYAAGFIATRMEVDKSILGLSAGGIALVVTLMTSQGTTSGTLTLNILAVVGFLGAITAVLVVLWQGGNQLAAAALGMEAQNNAALDYTARACFVFAVILTCVAGAMAGFNRLKQEEQRMTQKVVLPEIQRSLTGVEVFMPKIAPATPPVPQAGLPAEAPSAAIPPSAPAASTK